MPEYLRTLDRATPTRDYNEYTPQLGRRFRALKLWMLLRWFGLEGLRRRIERHIGSPRHSRAGSRRSRSSSCWPRCRSRRSACASGRDDSPADASAEVEAELDALNQRLMDDVNATGRIFLSHTRLEGRFTIRLAIGNIRTEERHVREAWELLRAAATATRARPREGADVRAVRRARRSSCS